MNEEYRGRPLDTAMEKIEWYLMKHDCPPHTKLPSERVMCQMWDLNRMTLRSAIQRLIADGRLYSKKGSGTYVAEAKIVRNLQDGRSMTEWLRQSQKGLESKVVSFQKVAASQSISTYLGLNPGDDLFELVRVRLVNGEPLILERVYVDAGRFPQLDRCNFEEASLYEVLARDYKTRIMGGKETVGLTYAGPEEADHLKVAQETALFFIDGTAWDQEDKPVEFFQSWIRGDRIQLYSVLKR